MIRIDRKYLFYLLIFFLILLLFFLVFYLKKNRTPKTISTEFTLQNEKIDFLVFGDSGTGSREQKALAQLMLEYPFDFILHAGDVAYPYGSREFYQWNFFNIYSDHLKRAPFYPSAGNHDYQNDGLASYLDVFDLPKNTLSENDFERYYSFDKGNIHFVALDTNAPLDMVSETATNDMADWLEKDLEYAKLSQWKIVYFHHPAYSSGSVHGGDIRVRKILVPILEKEKVDIVFSGHEHHYERSCPIIADTCADGGVVYIVTGGGGARLYDFGGNSSVSLVAKKAHHFLHVEVAQCILKARVIGLDSYPIDEFTLDTCDRK